MDSWTTEINYKLELFKLKLVVILKGRIFDIYIMISVLEIQTTFTLEDDNME